MMVVAGNMYAMSTEEWKVVIDHWQATRDVMDRINGVVPDQRSPASQQLAEGETPPQKPMPPCPL